MKKFLLSILVILLVSSLLVAVSCGPSSPGTDTQTTPPDGESPGPDFTPGTSVSVVIENLAFSPDTVTIDIGTTVVWNNEDFVNHTVTSRTGIFDSGIMSRGGSFSYTFNEAGDFEYYCTLHTNMVGHVIVK
jgi:plastocyanin